MAELEPVRADHESALLAFETDNRAFFATVISDRGDAYFEQFTLHLRDLVADQAAGSGAFYLLVEDGAVLGRFNLQFDGDGDAVLGYRMAEHACGRGLATATVRDICRLARTRHGLLTLRAATSAANVASQRVLQKAGFVPLGPAGPEHLGGKVGTWYSRDLTPE